MYRPTWLLNMVIPKLRTVKLLPCTILCNITTPVMYLHLSLNIKSNLCSFHAYFSECTCSCSGCYYCTQHIKPRRKDPFLCFHCNRNHPLTAWATRAPSNKISQLSRVSHKICHHTKLWVLGDEKELDKVVTFQRNKKNCASKKHVTLLTACLMWLFWLGEQTSANFNIVHILPFFTVCCSTHSKKWCFSHMCEKRYKVVGIKSCFEGTSVIKCEEKLVRKSIEKQRLICLKILHQKINGQFEWLKTQLVDSLKFFF